MGITVTPTPTGIEDLDTDRLLACLGQAETAERRAGLTKLEVALQWCVVHPATVETGPAVWGDAGLPGFDSEESLGGQGCPTLAAFAPEPFAAALGVSTFTGMQLLADALDLAYRLPRTWQRVQRLQVAPWPARRLAQASHHLSLEAAHHVDAQVVHRIDSCGATPIDRAVAQAAARFDPQAQADAEQTGKDAWDVRCCTAPTAAGPAPVIWTPPATPPTSPGSTTSSATTPPTSPGWVTSTPWERGRPRPSA